MPAKSRYSKRKPSMGKAKAMVAKSRKQKAKKNMDTFFLKARTEFLAIPQQGVTVSNYLSLFFGLLDPTGYQGVTQNAEFNLYKNLYDKVRINTIKMIVTPKANVLDQGTAQNDNGLTLTGDGLIHTAVDRDGSGPGNVARLTRYPSYHKYSVLKPFTRSYSIKYPMGVWLDCQTPAGFSMTRELGLKGGITLYAENILEDSAELFNEPWAEITVEHSIVFQGKVSTGLEGVYVDGVLTGVKVNTQDQFVSLDFTPPTETHGQLPPPPEVV